MPPFHQDQLERFLIGNQHAIADLVEQAYVEAGGHYALMTPDRRRQQAQTDAHELIADLLRGSVDRAEVHQIAHQAAGTGIAVDDIINMACALEPRFTAFVDEHLVAQPALRDDLLRRLRSVISSFRVNLATARLDDVLRRFSPGE